MPQPRKPTNVLHLGGATKRNAGRYRGRGEQPIDQRGIGRCPTFLTEAEKGAWRELVTNDPGVLQRADRIAVEMTARLMAEIRADDNITAAKQSLLASMLHKLGQTPTGRNNVSIPAPEVTNPFALD